MVITEGPAGWSERRGRYRVRAEAVAELDGGYSARVPALPGACGEGGTADAAFLDLAVSVAGLVEQYRADGVPVPWVPDRKGQPGAVERWLVVDV